MMEVARRAVLDEEAHIVGSMVPRVASLMRLVSVTDGEDAEHEMFCSCCRGLLTSALPPELLVDIFSLLSLREVCLQVALTCRAWHTLTHHQTLWQRMFLYHLAEELDDKRNRFRLLRVRRDLYWRREFELCVRSQSRDIRLHLHLRQGHAWKTVEVVVNTRDTMRKFLKKASQALKVPSVSHKIVFSFIEFGAAHHHRTGRVEQAARWGVLDGREEAESLLTHEQWMELESYEECVIRASSTSSSSSSASAHHHGSPHHQPSSSAWGQINRVRRLFLMERRHRRLAELRLLQQEQIKMTKSTTRQQRTSSLPLRHQLLQVEDAEEEDEEDGAEEQDAEDYESADDDYDEDGSQRSRKRKDTDKGNSIVRMAMVIVEDGDSGPCRRHENRRLNPPLVTYYVSGGPDSPRDERVGHFLAEGSVGTCLASPRHLLIDM